MEPIEGIPPSHIVNVIMESKSLIMPEGVKLANVSASIICIIDERIEGKVATPANSCHAVSTAIKIRYHGKPQFTVFHFSDNKCHTYDSVKAAVESILGEEVKIMVEAPKTESEAKDGVNPATGATDTLGSDTPEAEESFAKSDSEEIPTIEF